MDRRNILGLLVAVGTGVIAYCVLPHDDQSLTKTLVGTWSAVDPNNGSLHKRSEGVKSEQISFLPDGKLLYTVESQTSDTPTKTETWGWRVQKGRLQLQYIGEGSTQEWMGSFKFSVSDTKLAIGRKNYPVKEFVRISSESPATSGPA